ncbi:hypothetical protein LX99_00513 [Mucilaginibacter oryzae]|uniref:Colicin import membrane protein n=1 Tax=Mucilaginibacter oryzae TaxID=468058 RepID=A0A316HFP8_9SPHI|nr:hypothetical protein [Mucilaginibacter oryzae]PWK80049.1 hypothetical protein LX99_00513 [Mucilaginibacter oryzae]
MKTNYLKGALLLVTMTALTHAANAQSPANKKSYLANTKYDDIGGKGRERIETNYKGKNYRMELANNKLLALVVDGEVIPSTKWNEYSKEVAAIREQTRKDRIQAKKDQVQAHHDQQQAKLDQEQAARDQRQAKLDQEQAARDQERAKIEQERAAKDQEQAKRDREQAVRDQEQARRDQAQARLDQIRAKKDQERATEDRRLLQQLTGDLVADHIIPNEEALHDLSFNSEEMIVNGVKQPDSVFKKYAGKYKRFAQGSSSYQDGKKQFNGLHIHNN